MSPGDRLDCAPQYLDNCSHVASPWQVGSVTQGPPKNRSDRGWIRVQVRESFLQRMGSCDYGGRQVPSAAAHRPKTAVEQFNLSLKAETHRGWEGEEPGEEEDTPPPVPPPWLADCWSGPHHSQGQPPGPGSGGCGGTWRRPSGSSASGARVPAQAPALAPARARALLWDQWRDGLLVLSARQGASGESQGQESLVVCRLWGRTESDMTDAT